MRKGETVIKWRVKFSTRLYDYSRSVYLLHGNVRARGYWKEEVVINDILDMASYNVAAYRIKTVIPIHKIWRYMKLFKLGGQEIMFHRVKCLGKIHGKKSGTALQSLSSRYLQIWCWIAKSADVQFPPSLYANWLLLRWSFMTRPTCLLYTALSRALAITGVTLIPRKSPFSLGTSTSGNGLVFALFQDSGQEWVDRERFHT